MKFKTKNIKKRQKNTYVFENGKWKWKILKKTAGAINV